MLLPVVFTSSVVATAADVWRELGRAQRAFVGSGGALACTSAAELQNALRGRKSHGCDTWRGGTPLALHRWGTIAIGSAFNVNVVFARRMGGQQRVLPVANLIPYVPHGTHVILCRCCCASGQIAKLAIVDYQKKYDPSRLVVRLGNVRRTVSIYNVSNPAGEPIFSFASPVAGKT
jgi:hypothetical protein